MPVLGQATPPPQDGQPVMESPAPGSTGQGPAQPPPPNPLMQFLPMIIMIVVFYFILIRPQQKKMKEHQNLLSALGKGDKIVTTGGVVGTVINIKGDTLSIRSSESKLEIRKSNVAEVLEKSSSASQSAVLDESSSDNEK